MILTHYLHIVYINQLGQQGTVLILVVMSLFGQVGGQMNTMVMLQIHGQVLEFLLPNVLDPVVMMTAGNSFPEDTFLIWMYIWNLMIAGQILGV